MYEVVVTSEFPMGMNWGSSTVAVAMLRLGKTSVQQIKQIANLPPGVQDPRLVLQVVCSQVDGNIVAGTYVVVWLGSNNDKGAATEWKQGLRAVGELTAKNGGPNYRDQWTLDVSIGVTFPDSIEKLDFVAKASRFYPWFGDAPVIGLKDYANQTVRLLDATNPRQKAEALFTAIGEVLPGVEDFVVQCYPQLQPMFAFTPPTAPGTPLGMLVAGEATGGYQTGDSSGTTATSASSDQQEVTMPLIHLATTGPIGDEVKLKLKGQVLAGQDLIILSEDTQYRLDSLWKVRTGVYDPGAGESTVIVKRVSHVPDNAIFAMELLSSNLVSDEVKTELLTRLGGQSQ